jgi:hypothetical protein
MESDTSLPEYKRLREIWRSMRKRTMNKACKDYAHYGGRGIRVCPQWADDFEAFYQWAMAHGYRNDLTLDRVCNYRGYGPGNCRWVSRKHQALNRSTNTRLDIDGKIRTISQWAELSGTADYTICRRLERGWTEKEAVFGKKEGAEAPKKV